MIRHREATVLLQPLRPLSSRPEARFCAVVERSPYWLSSNAAQRGCPRPLAFGDLSSQPNAQPHRSPVISTEAQRSGETPVLALFQRSTKPGCPMSLALGDMGSQPNAQPHRSPVISTEAQRSGETPVLALLNPSTIRVSHVPRTWGHGFAGCPKQHPKHQTTEIHPNKPTIDPQLRPNDMH